MTGTDPTGPRHFFWDCDFGQMVERALAGLALLVNKITYNYFYLHPSLTGENARTLNALKVTKLQNPGMDLQDDPNYLRFSLCAGRIEEELASIVSPPKEEVSPPQPPSAPDPLLEIASLPPEAAWPDRDFQVKCFGKLSYGGRDEAAFSKLASTWPRECIRELAKLPVRLRIDCFEYFQVKQIAAGDQALYFLKKDEKEINVELDAYWKAQPLTLANVPNERKEQLLALRGSERMRVENALRGTNNPEIWIATFDAILVIPDRLRSLNPDHVSKFLSDFQTAFEAAKKNRDLIPIFVQISLKITGLTEGNWSQRLVNTPFFQLEPKMIQEVLECALKSDCIHLLVDLYQKKAHNLYDLLENLKTFTIIGFPADWIRSMLANNPTVKAMKPKMDLMECYQRSRSVAKFCFLYTQGDLGDLSKLFPLDTSEDVVKRYIVRKGNFAEDFKYGDQARYGALMHQAVMIGANQKDWGFDELCSFYAYQRYEMARLLKHEHTDSFGSPREAGPTFPYYTECRLGYERLGQELDKKTQKASDFFTKTEDQFSVSFQFKAPINGVWVNHSRLKIPYSRGFEVTTICHTEKPEEVKKMVDYARQLYNEALQESDSEIIMQKAGLIFWWLCQAKPWDRGDPSIAEMLIKTLFLKKKIPIQPWKRGIVPWEEVMKEFDPQAFARKFFSLFEKI